MTTPASGLAAEFRPEEWWNVIRVLRAGTLIDVVAYAASWHARFFVRFVYDMTVDIALLSGVVLGGPVEAETA